MNIQQNLYQQNTDLQIIDLLIPHLTFKKFIDIGAEKGSFTQFLGSRGLNGILFEPHPKFGEALDVIAKDYNCKFYSYAIDAQDRIADFFIAYDKADQTADCFSSLIPLTDDQRISHKKSHEVICRSLNSLLTEGHFSHEFGIVKTDTEGNDLNVLKGMSQLESEILVCEFFMPGIYSGWELGHPRGLIEEAKKLGFNHYIAIKRFDVYETVVMDDADFYEQEWGNLIFISEHIFNSVKQNLVQFADKKCKDFVNLVRSTTLQLRKDCEEKEITIKNLDKILKERDEALTKLDEALKIRDKELHARTEEVSFYRLLKKIFNSLRR